MKRTCVLWMAAVLMSVLTSGCVHVNSVNEETMRSENVFKPMPLVNEYFTVEGIPQRKYMVGGGVSVSYRAPADGTLYWVEETGRKIIMTKSLDSGEFFEEYLPLDDEHIQLLFKDMEKTRFVLYFVPSVSAED